MSQTNWGGPSYSSDIPDAVPQHELDASDHWLPSTNPPSDWNGVCRPPEHPKLGPAQDECEEARDDVAGSKRVRRREQMRFRMFQ
ncbi:hypothetical protein EDB83DRAFT_2523079 [Lactarius deliciosus]|nr:hypothetical protein EDB83DRAFT_2523079 [Lactarius deliciosus]